MNHRPKGVSQAECAKLAGVSRDTVLRYENGENVSIHAVQAILKVCGKKLVVTDINS